MNENIAISVSNLSKKYKIGIQKDTSFRGTLTSIFKGKGNQSTEFNALSNVSFEIKKGDVVGIIGKNGAGKSTLLKILAQITNPSSGRIELNGRIASLLEVGTGFHPELTGRENIFLNGTILGMTRKEVTTKFQDIVDFSGVEKFLDTPVKNYSSGMYVRLAFAVAAHLEPEILIIDEVLAVGDSEFQKKCLGKMKEVSGEGRTVLFVSHDLGMVQSLCNNCYWIDKGEVKSYGPTRKVVEEYTSVSSEADFENSPKINPVHFNNIAVMNSDGVDKSTFNFDQTINILGSFDSTGKSLRELQMCIALLDKNGNRVFSEVQNFPGSEAGEFHFTYQIPESLIAPGVYSFLFQLYPPPGNEIYDEYDGILPIKIMDNGSKLLGYSNFGHVILPNKIDLKKV